jgi:hypothetical protein
MPKQQTPQPWGDDQIDKFLKSRGHDPAAPATPEGSAAANPEATGYPRGPGVMEQIRSFLGAGDAPPGRAPTYGEMDWQQAAGQGAAREGARLGIGAAKLAGQVLPTSVRNTLGQMAEKVPGVKRMEEFADAPAEGPAEYIGQGAVDIAGGGMLPALRLGSRAAAMIPRTVTPSSVQPVWNMGRWIGRTVPAAVNTYPGARVLARGAGNLAEAAGKGAVGGAVTDPNDPGSGALHGAEGAVGGRMLGGALRSRPAQEIAGNLSRYGIPTGIGYAVGGFPGAAAGGGLGAIANEIGKSARHTSQRHYSTIGQSLDRFGRAVFDSTGRFLGYLPATVGGEAARVGAGERPQITVPRRAAPGPFELPESSDAQSGPTQNQ